MASLLAKTCNRLSTPAFSAATSEPALVESAPLESAPAEAVAHSTGTAVEGARKLLSVDAGEPGPEQAPVSTIRTAPPKLMVSPAGRRFVRHLAVVHSVRCAACASRCGAVSSRCCRIKIKYDI